MSEFAGFVRQHQDMVYSTALRITGDRDEAEDIAQETFVRAYSAFAALVGGEQAAGWLRTTARNLALNHVTRYRRRFSFLSFGSGAGERDLAASADDEAEWLYDRVARVKQALLELPRKFRLPLVLYYYEDMDYARIAAALGVSLAKVKTDIMRGRRRLRQLVDRLEETDGATASSGA